MSNGIWINPYEFVKFSEKTTRDSLIDEIASRKRSIDFYSLGMYLPNPDQVLKKMGKDIKVYNELITDAHLGGCLTSREAGVTSLEWEIDRGKSKSRQAKLIEDLFNDLDLDRIMGEILNAPLFGYQPLEVLWEKGKYWLPKDVAGKPQEWFVFSEDGELRFRTKENYNGEPLPERKFLLARYKATYKNPYGFPQLSRCFWPATFKKGGLKFWVIFTEKYGMPFAVGKVPRGTAQSEQDKLADMLEQMVQDAIAVIPDDSSVDILKTEGKASADIYSKLIDYCDKSMSIAILGQNLTTEVKGGSYAATESHMSVRKDIVDSDKKIVETVFNQLITWIWELNFASGEKPVFTMYEEEDVDKTLADRDKTLSDTGQIRFTKKYFQKNYGFEDEDIIVADQDKKPAEFSESDIKKLFADQEAVDELIDSIPADQLQEQAEGVLKPIIEMINSGTGFEDILDKLAEAYPEMEDDSLQEMLTRAIFVNEIWGRLHADS
jgi:phage gp29-like protein